MLTSASIVSRSDDTEAKVTSSTHLQFHQVGLLHRVVVWILLELLLVSYDLQTNVDFKSQRTRNVQIAIYLCSARINIIALRRFT